MARYTTTISSSLSPEAAFAELADFSSAQRWDPGVVSAVRIDDGEVDDGEIDEGPLRVGSRFHLVARFGGRDVPLDYEIVELEPPRKVTFRAENRTVVSRDTITFEPRGGTGSTVTGSTVTYDADLRLKGLLRLADPVFALMFRRIGDRARDGLRAALSAIPDGVR